MLMTHHEFKIARVGMLYALLGIAREVIGDHDPITSALYKTLRYKERFLLLRNPPRWLEDRFEAACDDLMLWEPEDREKMKGEFFAE